MTRPLTASLLSMCLSCVLACARPDPAQTSADTSTTADASSGAASVKPKGSLFSPQDLGLLDAPDRDKWQNPDQIMDALKIAEGSIVADLGAGGGWFTIRLARRVEQNGLVYAEDIQRAMLIALDRQIEREGLKNVQTVLGIATDPRLPAPVDAVLIVDAYHEMEDSTNPAQVVTLLKNIERSLKPQGCLGVVDFEAGGGGPGPAPDERVRPETVIDAARAAGLTLVKREAVPPFQFLLVFGKATGQSRCAG